MARPVRTLPITDAQRSALRVLARRPTSTQREAGRAQIILHRADGLSQQQTARRVGVNRPVVSLWENRFLRAGLADAKGRGRKPSIASAIQAATSSSKSTAPAPSSVCSNIRYRHLRDSTLAPPARLGPHVLIARRAICNRSAVLPRRQAACFNDSDEWASGFQQILVDVARCVTL
jgi:hypothetical protein